MTPVQSLVGALVAGGGLYLLGFVATKLLHKDAMGFGDVKLLAGFGALMGFSRAIEILVVASILGIIVMVPYAKIAERRAAKKASSKKSSQNEDEEVSGQIPFGPFLAFVAPFMYLWGNTLLEWYFSFLE